MAPVGGGADLIEEADDYRGVKFLGGSGRYQVDGVSGPGESFGVERRTVGGLRLLPFREATFVAATAFYSIRHVPRRHLSIVLGEIRRVLTVGGALLLATHLGEGEVYSEEFLGHAIRSTGGTL